MRGSDVRRRPGPPRKGFTLIELSVVMLIIGILLAFILSASYEAVRRAQVRATQGMIAKLDTGYNFRLDDVLSRQVEPNGAHQFMAAVFPAGYSSSLPWGVPSPQRAQVIAQYDLVKRELPDVFYVQTIDSNYPLNFAGPPYGSNAPTWMNYVLPLGHSVLPGYNPVDMKTFLSASTSGQATYLDPDGDGNPNVGPGAATTSDIASGPAGEGIYGASYAAAAGIYKNLGYLPNGYDGTDNNGNGMIDEYAEGVNGTNSAQVTANLANHTHKTARSEMLYALLVEGQGSRGPVFRREDFKDSEIGDTDEDGLPEFLDAWGEPIQFYRWPVHHGDKQLQTFVSGGTTGTQVVYGGVQQGYYAYRDSRQPRERSSLDPNNTLVAPAWWSASYNAGGGNESVDAAPASGMSTHAYMFQQFFHPLVDLAPAGVGSLTNVHTWDIGGNSLQRAFFCRHLIVSSGPDQKVGIPMIGFDYNAYDIVPPSGAPVPLNYANLIRIENCASDMSPVRQSQAPTFLPVSSPDTISAGIDNGAGDGWALDDITNQNLPQAGGGIQ